MRGQKRADGDELETACLELGKNRRDGVDRGLAVAGVLAKISRHAFEHHQIIFANGAPTESFFPGTEAMDALDPAQREELDALFPDLAQAEPVNYLSLRHWEAAAILTPRALTS